MDRMNVNFTNKNNEHRIAMERMELQHEDRGNQMIQQVYAKHVHSLENQIKGQVEECDRNQIDYAHRERTLEAKFVEA